MYQFKNKPFMGVAIMVLGALNVVLAIILMGMGSDDPRNPMWLGLGSFFIIIGILYLKQYIIVVDNGEVQMKNLLGMTLRTHRFDSMSDLRLNGSKVQIRKGEKWTNIRGFVLSRLQSEEANRFKSELMALHRDEAAQRGRKQMESEGTHNGEEAPDA